MSAIHSTAAYLRVQLLLHVRPVGGGQDVVQQDEDVALQVKGQICTASEEKSSVKEPWSAGGGHTPKLSEAPPEPPESRTHTWRPAFTWQL